MTNKSVVETRIGLPSNVFYVGTVVQIQKQRFLDQPVEISIETIVRVELAYLPEENKFDPRLHYLTNTGRNIAFDRQAKKFYELCKVEGGDGNPQLATLMVQVFRLGR